MKKLDESKFLCSSRIFFSFFASDGTIPCLCREKRDGVWSVYIPPLSPPSVAVRNAIRRSFISTADCRVLNGWLVRTRYTEFMRSRTTNLCSFSVRSKCSSYNCPSFSYSFHEASSISY